MLFSLVVYMDCCPLTDSPSTTPPPTTTSATPMVPASSTLTQALPTTVTAVPTTTEAKTTTPKVIGPTITTAVSTVPPTIKTGGDGDTRSDSDKTVVIVVSSVVGGLVLVGLVAFLFVILWRKRQYQRSKPTSEHHGRTRGALFYDGVARNPLYDGHVDRLDLGHHEPQQEQHHRSGHRYTSDKENQCSQGRHDYPSHAHYPAQQHHPHSWELTTAPYNQGYSQQGYQFYDGQVSRPGRRTSASGHTMSPGYTVYPHHSAPFY